MTDFSARPGIDAADLAFLEAFQPETRDVVAALGPACVVLRASANEALTGIVVALDRVIERELLALAVAPLARGAGLGSQLLLALEKQHSARDSRNRTVAAVRAPQSGGAGLLVSAGFVPASGTVRFRRRAEAFESNAPRPPARWLELARESEPKRTDLLRAAAAVYPGDRGMLPTLAALAAAPSGFVTAGFLGNDVKVVVAGHLAGSVLHVMAAYSAHAIRDHGFAEHALARVVSRGWGEARDVEIETRLEVPRVARTLFRLGFRIVDGASGFRLGEAGKLVSADVFAV